MSALSYSKLLQQGRLLGLAPREVWSLSVRELRLLLGPSGSLEKQALTDLCNAYPDDLEQAHATNEQ